ncbi:MAG TPA: PQQ-binding-like beta-propeller repeat protein [Planctomycetota bacterium]
MHRVRSAVLVLAVVGAAAAQEPPTASPAPAPSPSPAQQAQRLVRQLELPEHCSAAWRGLLALGPVAAPPLTAATSDPRPEIALRAFHVLGLLGADGEQALPRLREHAAGKDKELAYAAAWAIDRIEFRGRLLTDFQTGKVEHFDDAGQVIRTIDQLKGPWHAEPAGNGRILVSEYTARCVREIDSLGTEVWRHGGLRQPYHVQRLPNGHTVISDAGNNQVIEVSRDGAVVWQRTSLKRPVSAQRLPDGHTLIVEQAGAVFELDEKGVEIWRTEPLGCAMRAQRLNNGNTLITLHDGGKVLELGPDAKEAAPPFELVHAQVALRRRDGHTLLAGTKCWIELDATGKEIWRRSGKYAVGIYW